MTITIPGKPTAKQNPKASVRGKHVFFYSTQEKEMKIVRDIINSQWKFKPISGAVSLKIVFYMPIPMGTSKVKREKMLAGEILHTKRPDKDNMEKFLQDRMTGIVFMDDSQIVHTDSWKVYGDPTRTEIEIKLAKPPEFLSRQEQLL